MSDGRSFDEALGGLYERGDVIGGKYRLERVIGVGGMGIVLEAQHLDLEQKVAVKLLRPSRKADNARERFRREAQMTFGLTSEHAARIIDLGEEGEVLYMAMEYLEGQDFGDVLQAHGRLEVAAAVGYMLQACEAIAEAHALGIVHRDLKPENIFLCRRADGTPCVKVLDFGLAKWHGGSADQRRSLTRVNRGMGTPHYMAPEQWLSARDVGPGADIWALGVLLFQMVAGTRPFEEEDEGALCQAILFGEATDLDRYVPNPPAGLADVLTRCLAKRPEERWASASALAAALLPYAPTGPVEISTSASLPAPGASSSWGLSLSDVGEPPTRPLGDRDSVTNLMPVRQVGARDLARAGETAEPVGPSVRPPRLEDTPTDDTSQPVATAVAEPARPSRALVLFAALAAGGVAAFFTLRPTPAPEPVPEPAPAVTGAPVVAPEPEPTVAPVDEVETSVEDSAGQGGAGQGQGGAAAEDDVEDEASEDEPEPADTVKKVTPVPWPRSRRDDDDIYEGGRPPPRYVPRYRKPKPKPKDKDTEYIPKDL